jgi:hypothetical protein
MVGVRHKDGRHRDCLGNLGAIGSLALSAMPVATTKVRDELLQDTMG